MSREASRRKRRHQRQRASASIESLYSELQAHYPRAFTQEADSLHPLEIGIYGQIKEAVGDRYNTRVIHWTLQRHTNRRAYLRALASGKARVNLAGTVVGEVSQAQRQNAEAKLHAKRQFHQPRVVTEIAGTESTGQGGAEGRNPPEGSDGESIYEDKLIQCRDCDEAFSFTAGEQAFYASKGFTNAPTRCQPCRQRRKVERHGEGAGFKAQLSREVFSAICAECGQETQVPFPPSPERPVYCQECFVQHRNS